MRLSVIAVGEVSKEIVELCETLDRMSARLAVGKKGDRLEGRDTGRHTWPGKEKRVPGAVKEVECVVFVLATTGSKLRMSSKRRTIPYRRLWEPLP